MRPLLIALIVFASVANAGDTRVAFIRPPTFASDGDILTFQIRVDPRPEHRLLAVAAVEDGLVVRRSDEELDGDKAPRTRWVRLRLPAGDLLLIASVWDGSKELDRAEVPVQILSRQP